VPPLLCASGPEPYSKRLRQHALLVPWACYDVIVPASINGFYAVYLTGTAGAGLVMLAFRNGIVAGADTSGGPLRRQLRGVRERLRRKTKGVDPA
jgi:hypothetical protein